MADRQSWTVPPELAGERLDKILAVVAACSRAEARSLIDSGEVTVGDEPGVAAARLPVGLVIEAALPSRGRLPQAAVVPFAVVHEDDAMLIVDKPPGVVVHPGAGHVEDTLLNGLIARYPELLDLGEACRFGIVHRLDRETSGLLVVARTAEAHGALQEAMRRRLVERIYLALVTDGVAGADVGTIDAAIARDPRRPTRMALVREGRPARTHYRTLATWEAASLLEVKLETGRTHQIRVHLASVDAPCVGDATYGKTGGVADPGRVWLHAHRLRLTHPGTGREIAVLSPLPPDLAATLGNLGAPVWGEVPGDAAAGFRRPDDPTGESPRAS